MAVALDFHKFASRMPKFSLPRTFFLCFLTPVTPARPAVAHRTSRTRRTGRRRTRRHPTRGREHRATPSSRERPESRPPTTPRARDATRPSRCAPGRRPRATLARAARKTTSTPSSRSKVVRGSAFPETVFKDWLYICHFFVFRRLQSTFNVRNALVFAFSASGRGTRP